MKKGIRYALILTLLLAIVAAVAYAIFIARYGPDEEVVYRTVDDTELTLQIFSPELENITGRPAILFFFGGAWTSGTPAQFYPWASHFASQGWMGFTADYRVFSRNGTNAFTALDDARAAYQYLIDHAQELGIDPNKIVMGGGSAGGHLAAAVMMVPWEDQGDAPDPAGLVLLNAAINTAYEGSSPVVDLFEGRGKDISPFHHIRADLPPTYMAHGTQDALVPFEQVQAFCEEMTRSGNHCELDIYQGAGHGFFNWGSANSGEVLTNMQRFVEGL